MEERRYHLRLLQLGGKKSQGGESLGPEAKDGYINLILNMKARERGERLGVGHAMLSQGPREVRGV